LFGGSSPKHENPLSLGERSQLGLPSSVLAFILEPQSIEQSDAIMYSDAGVNTRPLTEKLTEDIAWKHSRILWSGRPSAVSGLKTGK